MRFLQTLTARVTIGTLILAATAAGLSIATTANQNRLNQEIRVIRTGYLRLALRTRDLTEKQAAHVDYLRDELVGESNTRRVESRIKRNRETRTKLLAEIDAALADQTDAPSSHERRLSESRTRLVRVRELVLETDEAYAALLASPPIESKVIAPQGDGDGDENGDGDGDEIVEPTVDPVKVAAEDALRNLQRKEGRILSKTKELARYQQRLVERIAEGLERGSGELRKYSIMNLVASVIVGLIVVVWTGLTLGPLRRLPIAAKRIAEGDYAARIPERGPTEVEVLAREFNQMAAALESRERELVRSERLATVGKVAAMITHEVRNPLSSIGLNTELLEEELGELGEPAAEARVLCKEINTEIDRLTAITETYLQTARLPQPRLHDEDIGELVRGTVAFVAEEMSKKAITIDANIAANLPSVEIDHAQIKQGLLNLLRNAAEALAETEHPTLAVEVSSVSNPGRVVIEVRDNGPGIPADVLPQLFEPFFTTKTSGTGLGLALTQQIVREHRGTLSVESKAGEGAQFTISLPIVSAPSLLAD